MSARGGRGQGRAARRPSGASSVVGLALVLACVAAGCGRGQGSPGSRGEVRLALEAEPAHLNPLLAGDLLALRITLGDVYEPLWEEDPEGGHLVPVLATSWRRSADDREWVFTIRDGVRWHDGRPFGAADVVFTLRLLEPDGAPTPLAADFDDLQALEILPGGREVRLRFGGFRVGRDRTLARVPILPAHVFSGGAPAELPAHPASRAPVGTGPYRFVGWDPGRAISLERFPDYWGRPPALARAVYRVVPDAAQTVLQLGAGELDLVSRVAADELDALARDREVVLFTYDVPTFTAVTWNCRRGALGDPRVRRALSLLIDRPTAVAEIFGGRARLQNGPWTPGDPAADPQVPVPGFDPAAARTLLGEAGIAGGLHVKVLYPQTSRTVERVLAIWREDARSQGVEIEPEPAPYERVLERAAAGDFDAVALGWTSEREQDLFHVLHASQIGVRNLGGFRDAEIDRLLEAIRRAPAPEARRGLERELHRRLVTMEPFTVIAGDVRTAAARRGLGGVRFTAFGAPVRWMHR